MKWIGSDKVSYIDLGRASGEERDFRRHRGWKPGLKFERWESNVRLTQFESWLELETNPVFQLHKFTDEFLDILKKARYDVGAENVKAILVEAVASVDVKSSNVTSACISMKVPKGDGINSGRGLLVYERPKIEGYTEALADPVFGVPLEQNVFMNINNKVVSMTTLRVRLCPSNRLVQSYAWGEFDRRYPKGYRFNPPDEDMESLGHLSL